MIKHKDFDTDWSDYLAKAAGGLVVLLGVVVMLGWFADSALLVQLQPQWVPMQFNTALGFVICGAGLLFLLYNQRHLAISCGALVLGLGMFTLMEYFFDLSLGIDEFFIESSITIKSTHPGRMALATALTFLISGIGLMTASLTGPVRQRVQVYGLLGTIIAAIGVGTLFGYLLGGDTPFNWSHLTYMAVHTATGFFLFGIGLLVHAFRNNSLKGRWPNWISAVAGIGLATLAVSLWQSLLTYEQLQAEQIVARQAKSLRIEVGHSIKQQVLAMDRMARRWEYQGGTSLDLWRADAELYLSDNPALVAISWVDPSMQVRWFESSQENAFDKNLDSFAESRKTETMDAARQTRATITTPSIELGQGGRGILVYVPLYIGDRFDGFIKGTFHIDKLFDPFVDDLASKNFEFRLFEGDVEIYHYTEPGTVYGVSISQEQAFSILNLDWRLSLQPSQALLMELESPLPMVTLIVGLLLSILIAFTVHFAQVSGTRADRLALLNRKLAIENVERIRAEKSFEESSLWLEGIISAMKEGVMVVTTDRQVVSINPACEDMLGYSQEEIIGQPTSMLHVDHEHYVRFGKLFMEAFNKGDVSQFEFELRRKNGEVFPTEHALSLLKNNKGEAIGIVSTVRDITERKQTEGELRRYRSHLKDLVIERTAELEVSNNELQQVIEKQQRTEETLRDHE
ncbi:MAG: PAS domain S-box protein, partial [Gammaproteobacteria bacterium]|nr:PAS domain S-box protein [Gammaproteobacteria bacterium]